MNDKTFVAINIVTENNELINEYPIIYFWDGTSEIDDFLLESNFIEAISKKITKENFHKLKINRIYVPQTYEEDFSYYYKSNKVCESYALEYFDLTKEYLWEILNFLYICAYKEDFKTKYDFKNVYESLLKKYPKKINKTTIENFIQSKLKESYPDITQENIEKITKKFREEIEK